MRRTLCALTLGGLLATATLSACTGNDEPDDGAAATLGAPQVDPDAAPKVGVILPDSRSSERWTKSDPRFLQAAFDEAEVPVQIANAEGDREQFVQIARSMIETGAKVLIIVSLDATTGGQVLQMARSAGVKTIDYDRLTLNGHADYYVSFDGRQVGRMLGTGLQNCLEDKGYENPVVAELNGSPDDNNATDFKAGYDAILQPKYDDAEWTKGPDQWVPDWSVEEGGAIFAQMLDQQKRIRGVLAANDGLADAAIAVLKERELDGKVMVTGQDASVQGLRHLLAGDQCMTVYKPVRPQAEAAARVAVSLFRGELVTARTDSIKDPRSGQQVPFLRLEPKVITKANVGTVVEDGHVTRDDLCADEYAELCDKAGI